MYCKILNVLRTKYGQALVNVKLIVDVFSLLVNMFCLSAIIGGPAY